MAKVALPIGGGSYPSESPPVSQQRAINLYVDIVQAAALSQEILKGTPGINQLATTGEIKQVNRGSETFKNRSYHVNGDKLYRLNRAIDGDGIETFTTTSLGTIDGTGFVFMSASRTQLMILVPGGKGYIFVDDPGDSLVEITDAGFTANGAPQSLEFISSFFACTTDEDLTIFSSQNDGLAWNDLDKIAPDADPDALVGLFEYKSQLMLMGTETTQVATLVTTADTPLQIQRNFELSKGLSSPFGVAAANDTFLWVGSGKDESPAIWQFAGASTQKVSTTAIDNILQGLTDTEVSNIHALSYAQKGAYFVNFYLPDTTLSYNTITQKWNDVQSDIVNSEGIKETTRSRVNSLTTAYGRVIVGDSQDGRIGELSPEIFSEYSNEIKSTLITQPFSAMGNAITTPYLELTMESGVGNSDTPDPVVRMSRSTDGHTFSDELTRKIGKRGEYKRRQIWHRVNRAERFDSFKFVISGKIKKVIIKLEGDVRQLTR